MPRNIHSVKDLEDRHAVITQINAVTTFVEFDSITDLADVDYAGRTDAEDGDRWTYGTHLKTYADNKRAISRGEAPDALFEKYLRMRDKLQPAIDKYTALGVSTRRKRARREEGDELDLDRYLVGDPVCWIKRVRGKKRKRIRLAIQYGYLAGADENVYVRGAAWSAAAADVLQRLGYAVEIVGFSWGFKNGKEKIVTVPLKHESEPLDPRKLLIAGLPAMSRIFEFGVYDAWGPGYVRSMRMPPLTKAAREYLDFTAKIGQEWTLATPESINYDPAIEGFLAEAEKLIAGTI